jgi:NTE family protein
MPKEKNNTKGIALALGGGAARGLAHIGVLKVLEKHHIPISAISGVSMGALIGGLYASGVHAIQLENLAQSIDWRKILQFLFPNQLKTSGLLNGKSIEDFVRSVVGEINIEKLSIQFYTIATDLWSGKSVVLDSGPLAFAIRASSSFPFLFTPVPYRDLILVDGGVSNPLGIDVLRERTSVPIVCSVVTPSPMRRKHQIYRESALKRHKIERFSTRFALKYSPYFTARLKTYLSKYQDWTLYKSLSRPNLRKQVRQIGNIMEHQLVELSLKLYQPEVTLTPDISEFNFFDFLQVKELIQKGEEETQKKISHIISLLNQTSHIHPSE